MINRYSNLRIGNEVWPIIIVFRFSVRTKSRGNEVRQRLANNYCFQISVLWQLFNVFRSQIAYEVWHNNYCFQISVSAKTSRQYYCFQISISAMKSHQLFNVFQISEIGNELTNRLLSDGTAINYYCFQISVSATKSRQ